MAEQIYQISDMTLLEHAFTITSDNLDDVIVDSSQDLMDVLMTTLWSAHKKEDASARTKMMDLLSALTKSIKNSNRHLVGMRWWSFFARYVDASTGSRLGILTCNAVDYHSSKRQTVGYQV